jgi:TIR domain
VAFDVFISYASKDKVVADAVCARLESAGIRCWIAPRDIVAGRSYGEAIIEAIHVTKVMVLVFSSNANASGHIPKEVERAVSSGLAILPFRIEDVSPGKSLDYFIGSVHWLDAMFPPMEKHLDDLASTVQKLLPTMGADPSSRVLPSAIWRSAPGIAETAPPATNRPAQVADSAPHAPSSKNIWIGAAAVAVFAVIVAAVMIMRSGAGNSPGVAVTPGATSPLVDNPPLNAPNTSGTKTTTPDSRTTPPPRSIAVEPTSDPIVGCYQWVNNATVVVRADRTVTGGPFTGHWRVADAARHSYTLAWPEAVVDTITISPDPRALSGVNQYGYPVSGTRISGTSGLPGTWRWSNGVPVIVSPSGVISAGPVHGRWQALDSSGRVYSLTWPAPVDTVTLSGSRLSGMNQYGVAISGTRTGPCPGS